MQASDPGIWFWASPEAFNYWLLLRLFAATVLGGLIGYERGSTHDAGLRTHIIVCLGAATVMVVSESVAARFGIPGEVMRMSAQVISGIGFLGAGSIIIDGNRVRGITTAAGLWTTACVGLAVGAGYYIVAFVVVALMIFTMVGLRSFAHGLPRKPLEYSIKVEVERREVLRFLTEELMACGVTLKSMKVTYDENKKTETESVTVLLDVLLTAEVSIETVIGNVGAVKGVNMISA